MNKKNTSGTFAATTEKNPARDRLVRASQLTANVVMQKYRSSLAGYTPEQAEQMRARYGRNEISRRKQEGVFRRLTGAFINPFTVVLFVLAAVSFITDVAAAPKGQKNPAAVIIIVVMVTVSGLLHFVQKAHSGKQAQKLGEMVETTISVARRQTDGRELPINEIVVGDVVKLAAGDMIPADLRILEAKDLFVGQSAMTGESDPVEKTAEAVTGDADLFDRKNLAFMGSTVVSGSALAVVIAVGDETVFGSMAKSILGKKEKTSFENGVNAVSWLFIRFMAVMAPVVFFVNGFTKGSWVQALLFALSVAVGLTPEMLPMLVSANLARGAVAMSKQKVIVKDLGAIQNLGAMDVLCTDKTGTLTQDKVTLLYSLDIHGNDDERVLRHAFINSAYQTGLKNLMDIAVISHAEEHGLSRRWSAGYKKVDEIPFDFSRRRMSVVVSDKTGKTQLITKGAVEEMLSVCSHAEFRGQVESITDEIRREITETVASYNSRGMRVLAVAQKSNPSPVGTFSVEDERGMVLMGYLAFLDPPKESTAGALRALAEYGVNVKILTGDNEAITRSVCRQVGIAATHLLLGSEIECMDDEALRREAERATVFAKLSPGQKARVVTALRDSGHTVGFMGDGINDAAAMKAADVGISVDTAVDIAKETANIILLQKDLMVLERGVIEGRRTYANIIKYIKMTASSNFGNMLSVLAACLFLPFLPMTPLQLLTLNLIYDISCLTIAWDHVDNEFLLAPHKWDASTIGKFMIRIGPVSSVFDIVTYLVMFFVICPIAAGENYAALDGPGKELFVMVFHTGWFVESLWSQTLAVHMLRTPKVPLIQSRASWQLTILTVVGIAVGTLLPLTPMREALGMAPVPLAYLPCLAGIIFGYMGLVTLSKRRFVKKYGGLL